MPAAVRRVDDLGPFVAAALAGDAQAFGQVVGATSSLVASIALAIVRDLDLSQEIAQDVFLSAWRDRRKLRNPASFLPWLRQMTRNRAHHALRSRVRARRRMLSPSEDHPIEAVVDGRPGVTERLLAQEELAALRDALAALPAETREALALYYREGQSVAQVAALLDLTEDAVKKRLSRARATLRESLVERLGQTLGATAPGAAFETSVMAALPLATPGTASALAASASKASGGAAGAVWASLHWLLMAAAAIAVTAAAGVLGVLFGGRSFLTEARDEQERRELRRFVGAAVAAVLLAAIGFEFRARSGASGWGDAIVFGAFTLALVGLYHVWLPRIVRRRFEAEMREDPLGALARRRRERRCAAAGWALGLGGAWLALILKLWL